jgi:hypothetical protein
MLLITFILPYNARLQPPAARNARIERDARIEGAPTVGCKPQLDSVALGC